jgi:hypothetical protein
VPRHPLGFQDQPSSAAGAAAESTAAQAQGRFQLLHPDADDRWLWLHGTLPSARERIAAALGVPQDIENVAAIVRRNSKADEIERRLVDGRCVAPASRTPQEWLAGPAGAAVDAEPLAHIIDHPRNGSAWRPTPRRPLAGLRVLDLTRVFAAPTGTRRREGWSRTVPTMPTSRNENTNRLLRQHLPKGADLHAFSQADLDAIVYKLTHRPRKTHGCRTPADVDADLLNSGGALTA